jgi:hypothetical protein
MRTTGQQEPRTELDEETADIMPDRILTPEEAKQDHQKQLEPLAQQEAEHDVRKRSGLIVEDGSCGEEKAAL